MLSYAEVCDVGRGKAGLNLLKCGNGVNDSCQSSPWAPPEFCLKNIMNYSHFILTLGLFICSVACSWLLQTAAEEKSGRGLRWCESVPWK